MPTHLENLKSLNVGQLLLVETNAGELLAGTLKRIDTKNFMIELDDVRDIKTNYTYQSLQVLAYAQMKDIKLILNENDIKRKSDIIDPNTESNLVVKNFIGFEPSIDIPSETDLKPSTESEEKSSSYNIKLTTLDLQLLQKQLDTTTLITQTDHKYHNALKDIKSQTVVGLLIDPIEMGRHCKTSLMAISTTQNIYIFDMLALGGIFKELRLILEAERPHKAVHFSHKIADHLRYRQKVLLKGMFDTFLAYCIVTNKKTNLTLVETIKNTFNISDAYFQTDATSVNSYQRPLPQAQRVTVAKKVAFQLKLYDYLLHEYMLRNFYSQCEKFSQTFCENNDNFHVGQQLHASSRAGYEHIQPNGNWEEKLNIDLSAVTIQQTVNNTTNFHDVGKK